MDYRKYPTHQLAAWLSEIEADLNYFRAPVSSPHPETGVLEELTLPERLAAHLNPRYDSAPRTPRELQDDVAQLRAQLALQSHTQFPNGSWCGTCFETWPCHYAKEPT